MVWLEVLIILAASRAACLASDADTAKRLFLPIFAHWSEWSKCSATCGNGESVRHWICSTPLQLIGKRSTCPSHSERQICSSGSCPIADPWSSWSTCTQTCGGGHRSRQRMCHHPNGPSHVCDTQKETCETKQCPIAVPAHWSEWSSCSATCGTGESVRHWICTTLTALIGKRSTCTEHSERQTCSSRTCPIDGHWGSWSEWSKCPVTCVGQSQNRHRACNNPAPSNGGRQCEGSDMESQNCPISVCRVDGHWSGWSEFSKCTVSCGLGTQIRSRNCSNPAPSNGGLDCLGSSVEASICSFPACVPESRVCDKVRLLSSISHNYSVSQNGDTSCTDPSYHSSRVLIQELCKAPSTSLHFDSQVIDVCNQLLPFSPVVRKDDVTGNTDYGILIECHGNQLKVASQDCNHNVHFLDLDGTESDKYYVVKW